MSLSGRTLGVITVGDGQILARSYLLSAYRTIHPGTLQEIVVKHEEPAVMIFTDKARADTYISLMQSHGTHLPAAAQSSEMIFESIVAEMRKAKISKYTFNSSFDCRDDLFDIND